MEVCKFGERIDATVDPIGAARLALRAASGCGSKASAWSWADDAVKAASFYSVDLSERLKTALNSGPSNFPNVEIGEKILDSITA